MTSSASELGADFRRTSSLLRSNAQRSGMVMWDECINEVAKEFPDVALDHMLGKPFEDFATLAARRSRRRSTRISTELRADLSSFAVDAMTVRMVLHPESLDTIVATNLHADILSDLAAALAGSIGIAPTANLDPSRKNPSSEHTFLRHPPHLLLPSLSADLPPNLIAELSPLQCLSLSMAPLSTSPAWESPTPSRPSGRPPRCSSGWERRRPARIS